MAIYVSKWSTYRECRGHQFTIHFHRPLAAVTVYKEWREQCCDEDFACCRTLWKKKSNVK